jgi:hypothetical protein
MPSNSEMYERGALDAEHDELNTFYYQHYYYYRRGYDDARRRTRASGRLPTPLLLLLALALGLGVGAWWFLGREEAPTVTQAPVSSAPTIVATVRPTVAPTPRPTQTAAPTALITLGIGGRARVVNLNGAPLRAREAPGLSARVAARIPEGSVVTLRDGPVEADGYQWWNVEAEAGAGWVAGRAPDGVAFLEVAP